jgi:hypothetical protein
VIISGLRPYALPRLRPGAWVSVDTETSGLYPDDGARVSTVSVAWLTADETACVCGGEVPGCTVCAYDPDEVRGAAFPFAHGVEAQPWFNGAFALFGGDEDLNLPAEEWEALRVWLSDKRIVMHNAQYDLIMTDAGVPEWRGFGKLSGMRLDDLVQWDSMLACKSIWPTEAKGLGPTVARLKLGTKLGDPVKDWIRKNKARYVKMGYPTWGSGYDLVPWLLMSEYAAEDAVLTLKVFLVQRAMFLDGYGDWTEFSGKQMSTMKQFVKMERRGMPFPREYSASFVGVLETKQRKVGRELPFTPSKDGAVKFFFTEDVSARGSKGLGLIPNKTSDRTGKPSLDAEVLSDLATEEVPHAKDWKLFTDLGRLASMYYGGYADKTGKDGRLRARIRQIREETKTSDGMADRFSIERVNLQAMPHDGKLKQALEGLDVPSVRHLIAHEVKTNYPDWELWEFDMSQAELRVGALLSGCKKMVDAFIRGDDVHQLTADLVGVPRNPVAKSSNFLLIFDGGWQTFQGQVKKQTLSRPEGPVLLSASQAKNIVYPWKRTYPQFKKMADKWEEFANRTGYVPLANGQLRWFTFREDKRKAWNQVVQGSIAQFFQEWLLAVEEICETAGVMERATADDIGGAGPLMTVHDSIICLVPADLAVELGQKIKAAAVEIWEDLFPGVPGDVDAKQFA